MAFPPFELGCLQQAEACSGQQAEQFRPVQAAACVLVWAGPFLAPAERFRPVVVLLGAAGFRRMPLGSLRCSAWAFPPCDF